MGAEIILLVLLAIAGVVAFLFFTGAFGAAKATTGDEGEENKHTHAYVENETKERIFGADSTDQVRERAERDPDTEVRS